MSRAFRQFVRNWREDGGLTTVLLFIVPSLAGAAGAFALTAALLGTRDTMMSYVPADAVLYAHASRAEASRALLGTLPEFSIAATKGSLLQPYEAAIYVVERDGARHHAVLLGWRKLIGPTSDEAAFMKVLGAQQLDDRRFIVADPELVTASRLARAANGSLAANQAVRGALRRAATGSLIQAYAFPMAAYGLRNDIALEDESLGGPSDPTGATRDLLASAEPMVISANIRGNGSSFTAMVTPISLLDSPEAPRADTGMTTGRQPLPLARVAAEIALTGPTPAFDVVSLFPMEDASAANASYGGTEEAEEDTRSLFAAPYSAWLRPASDQAASYALHLPSVAADDAFAALARLYAAHHPEVRPFALPDDDSAYELVARAPVAHPSTEGDAHLPTNPAIIVGHDGHGGSFISNSQVMMDTLRGIANSAQSNIAPCPKGDAQLRLAAPLAAKIPLVKPFIRDINGNPVVIHTAWGKGVFICGYLR